MQNAANTQISHLTKNYETFQTIHLRLCIDLVQRTHCFSLFFTDFLIPIRSNVHSLFVSSPVFPLPSLISPLPSGKGNKVKKKKIRLSIVGNELRWQIKGTLNSKFGSMNLSLIKRILWGKRTDVFHSPENKDLNDNNCFRYTATPLYYF